MKPTGDEIGEEPEGNQGFQTDSSVYLKKEIAVIPPAFMKKKFHDDAGGKFQNSADNHGREDKLQGLSRHIFGGGDNHQTADSVDGTVGPEQESAVGESAAGHGNEENLQNPSETGVGQKINPKPFQPKVCQTDTSIFFAIYNLYMPEERKGETRWHKNQVSGLLDHIAAVSVGQDAVLVKSSHGSGELEGVFDAARLIGRMASWATPISTLLMATWDVDRFPRVEPPGRSERLKNS